MVEIRTEISKTMDRYYDYELIRNENKTTWEKIRNDFLYTFSRSFFGLNQKLKMLSQGVQSKLSIYLNWTKNGTVKFADWSKGLIK